MRSDPTIPSAQSTQTPLSKPKFSVPCTICGGNTCSALPAAAASPGPHLRTVSSLHVSICGQLTPVHMQHLHGAATPDLVRGCSCPRSCQRLSPSNARKTRTSDETPTMSPYKLQGLQVLPRIRTIWVQVLYCVTDLPCRPQPHPLSLNGSWSPILVPVAPFAPASSSLPRNPFARRAVSAPFRRR